MDTVTDAVPVVDTAVSVAPRRLVLELALEPEQARLLPRLLPASRRRRSALRLTWHDTPDFDLAAAGLALVERQQGRRRDWRLERVPPETGESFSPGMSVPAVAEATEPGGLGPDLPAPRVPLAGFVGHSRSFPLPDETEISLLSGTFRVASATQPCCRVVLGGPPAAVAELADRLAGRLHLSVPIASLAAQALALAGHPVRRHRRPPVALTAELPVGKAFACVVGRLVETMLDEASRAGSAASEPVHQVRIAVRRLRSALEVFGKAVRCPELAAARAGLQILAKALAPARDWDVFNADTGRALAAEFAGDHAVRRLLRGAERRRLAAYAALQQYLASPEFRRMTIVLAVLAASRPWETTPPTEDHEGDLAGYAARALDRRLRRLRASEADIKTLPPETLHRLRLRGKRLKYAAEFFVPLYPGRDARRFVRRLARLLERLGRLNDAAVAAALVVQLGTAHGYAGGVVRGLLAARATGDRQQVATAWRRFLKVDSFWS